MCYVSAVTAAAAAADFCELAAKTTLLFQYGLLRSLHYLVSCPQTGILCLPAGTVTAYKMMILHGLQFLRKYLDRICVISCVVIRQPKVIR